LGVVQFALTPAATELAGAVSAPTTAFSKSKRKTSIMAAWAEETTTTARAAATKELLKRIVRTLVAETSEEVRVLGMQIAFRDSSQGVTIKIPHENHSFPSQRAKRISQKMEVFMLHVRCVSLKT
jgi:hypothetical protein